MSLKTFHIFFIVVSILLTAGFGIWILLTRPVGVETLNVLCALLSFSVAGGLFLYAIRFLKKFKHISYM